MVRLGGPVYLDGQRVFAAAASHGAADVDPVVLAKAHKAKGFSAAYAPRIGVHEAEKIRDFRTAFATEDVIFGEVGYWENLMDTDRETRTRNRAGMVDALALADELGAKCVVGLAGSYCHGGVPSKHEARNFSPEAFDETVELARYFLDLVKPKRACFTYEVYQFDQVDSVEMLAKLLKAVDRNRFGIHLDLTNFVNCPRAYWTSGDIMRECVRRFGDRIVAAHAKDVKMKEPAITVILEEVLPGEGNLDIAACLRELHKLPQAVPYLMEHLKTEEEYDRAAAHIRSVAAREGVRL